MARDGREHTVAQVVGAVGQDDEEPFRLLVGIAFVGGGNSLEEACGIVTLNKDVVVVFLGFAHHRQRDKDGKKYKSFHILS